MHILVSEVLVKSTGYDDVPTFVFGTPKSPNLIIYGVLFGIYVLI